MTLPRPDRLRYILSAVINFYFFAEEQGERVLRPLQDEMTELAQEEVALIEENQKLRDRIEEETCVTAGGRSRSRLGVLTSAAHRARRLENQAKMAAYRPEEERNTEMMKAAHRAIDDHGAQKRALKLDCEELRRRLTDLQQENSNIDLAIMDLRGQIISSPEKLRGKIDEMQDQLNREKEMFQETEVKERQTQSKINALTQYSQVRQRFTRSQTPAVADFPRPMYRSSTRAFASSTIGPWMSTSYAMPSCASASTKTTCATLKRSSLI